MIDSAVSYDQSGNMSVDTYGMDDFSIGTNDFGEALYDIGGVEMTEAQANENHGYYAVNDDGYGRGGYDYGNSSYDQDDTLPEPIIESFNRIDDVLGGGAADWIADELLGIGDSRMTEVLQGTHMSQDEIQSHATAVIIDLAHNMGMDSDMLMGALSEDIAFIRSARSPRATSEMHEVIADAVAGNYHESMTRWNRLRAAMQSVR